jgi:hypothetical protein
MKADARRAEGRHAKATDPARDTDATAFTALLVELIDRIPGARAAALVDRDGESVDYAGELSPFDVKVAAAHWRIVLGELDQVEMLSRPRQVVVRGREKSFVLRSLAESYAIVVVLSARAGFASSTRAFEVFERALLVEAGIGVRRPGPTWIPVLIQCDARARPQSLASATGAVAPLEVLGAVMGLGRSERGFRVRLTSGVETTVVREPGGTWYADEPIDQSAHFQGKR